MDVPSYNKINELALHFAQLYNGRASGYARFEIGEKKSLLMINPVAKQVFYIDRLGRPLLELERQELLRQLPSDVKFVDISRSESSKDLYSLSGFHANQPVYSNDAEWLAYATDKIENYSSKVETAVDRFQAAPVSTIGQFFAKSKTGTAQVAPADKVSTDASLKDSSNNKFRQ